MKIKKGLATYAGLVAAFGQYLGSFALFMEADDKALALGPLATATATLWKVIEGRMNQATAAIQAQPAAPAPAVFAVGGGSSGTNVTTSWNPSAAGARAVEKHGEALSRLAEDDAELGDMDALPDYRTENDPPPDLGDTSSNGDVGVRAA